MSRRALGLTALGVLGVPLVLVGVLFLLIATNVIRTYRVSSASMDPTLRCERPDYGCTGSSPDRVLIEKYIFSGPKRGDVVAFRAPPKAEALCGSGGIFVKRIVAGPGDTFKEAAGSIYVDGKRPDEPFAPARFRDTMTVASVEIPAGRYFLMGDNRQASCDSRRWGPLPRTGIIGKVGATYWPLSRLVIR